MKKLKNKYQIFFFSLFYVSFCLYAVHFAGCQSTPSHPGEKPSVQEANKTKSQVKIDSSHSLDQYIVNKPPQIKDSNQTENANSPLIVESQIPKTRKQTITMPAREQERTEDSKQKIEDERPKHALPVLSEVEGRKAEGTEILPSIPCSLSPDFNMPILDKADIADELISVNFNQVDIRTMLKTIGDITGINFVIDENVRGTVTVISPTKIPMRQIYRVLQSILDVAGYAAVPAGDLVKILPRAEAIQGNLQVCIGGDPSNIAQSDSIITQIIPLNYADVGEISQIIQPLLASGSHMAIYPRTNSIVITDTSFNIHHIAKVIQQLDVADSQRQVTTIGLKYASAKVLSEQIIRIMEKNKAIVSPSGRSQNVSQTETDIKILPDTRTNSLIIVANAQDTQTIEALIESLDIQRPNRASNIHVVYLKNAQAEEAAKSLATAVANLKITGALESTQDVQVSADAGTNALIITASAQDYEVIADIIEKLDIVREQVLVEMLIVEVSEDALKEIGIDWSVLDQAVTGSVRFFGQTNFGPRVDFLSGDSEGLSIGAWKKNGTQVTIGPILHALEKKSGVNILSTPHITTSNHQKAKIVVGENVPFVTQSRITETTDLLTPTVIKTYEYKDVGISLEITPHISQGGLVRLEISSEFTKLVETVSSTTTDTPTTAKREAQTVVTMNSDSTVVIGGLIRDDKVTTHKNVPLISDIPLIGELFKFRKDRLQKTNLLIFITPHVMANQQDLEQMTGQKKEQMNRKIQDRTEKNGNG
jgi:general secretion pathway protein D